MTFTKMETIPFKFRRKMILKSALDIKHSAQKCWKMIAKQLGLFSNDYYQIEKSHESEEEKFMQMLEYWIQKESHKATIIQLKEALEKEHYVNDANRLWALYDKEVTKMVLNEMVEALVHRATEWLSLLVHDPNDVSNKSKTYVEIYTRGRNISESQIEVGLQDSPNLPPLPDFVHPVSPVVFVRVNGETESLVASIKVGTKRKKNEETCLYSMNKHDKWTENNQQQCVLSPQEKTTLFLGSRLKSDSLRVGVKGGQLKSTVRPELSVHFPKGAIAQETSVQLQVENKEIDDREGQCDKQVTNTGPMVHVTCDHPTVKSVTFSIPMLREIRVKETMIPRHTHVTTKEQNQKWKKEEILPEMKNGLATFNLYLIASRLLILLFETEVEISSEEITKIAEGIEKDLYKSAIVVIARQNKVDMKNVVVECCQSTNIPQVLDYMKNYGYTEGLSMPSGEFFVNKSELLTLMIDGDIKFAMDETALSFLYNAELRCCRKQFRIKEGTPAQGVASTGTLSVFRKPTPDMPCCDFSLTLPKPIANRDTQTESAPAPRPVIEKVMHNALEIKWLVKNKWKAIAGHLGLHQNDISKIDCSMDSADEKFMKIIELWVNTHHDASVEGLRKAVIDADKAETANYIV